MKQKRDNPKAFNHKKAKLKFCHSVLCEAFVCIVVNFFNTKSTKNSQRTPGFKKSPISFGVEFCSFTFGSAPFRW